MEQFGIIYLLPEPAKTYHERLRLDIEKKFKLTGSDQMNAPSHITMKYRFETERIEEVENILESFSRTQAKTPWSVTGFNHFINPDFRVIFIDVEPSQAVREAHARFLQQLKRLDWMQWDYANEREQPQFNLFFDNLALLKIEAETHSINKRYLFRG